MSRDGPARVLDDAAVGAILDGVDVRAYVVAALEAFTAGAVEVAPRVRLGAGPGGQVTHVRVARDAGTAALVVKTTDYDPQRPERQRRPSVVGSVSFLVDGTLRFVAPAGAFTAHRTAAATTFVLDRVARADARVLAIVGAGVQAEAHARALAAARPLAEIRLVSRSAGAERLAGRLDGRLGGTRVRAVADVAAACRGADVVVTATTSATPVLAAADVDPGTAVALLGGGNPPRREAADDLLARATAVYVEDAESARGHAGEIMAALDAGVLDDRALVPVAKLLAGPRPVPAGGVSVYKSVGLAWQDLACAQAIADHLG